MIDESLARSKKEMLLRDLGKLDSLLVAFSGGVDSSFLLASAQQALGDRIVAVTATSSIHPRREQDEASEFAREREISHIIFKSDETKIPEFLSNGPERCYYCKKALSEEFLRVANEKGISHVAHGANADDLGDYRPGFRAAEEAGIIAPLIDAGLLKDEIRFLAKEMGLSAWDKPAMACLASRFPYGTAITEKGLKMVEKAEEFLLNEGFRGLRVRHHGPVARIEISTSDLGKILSDDTRRAIVEELRSIGFEHIALDLEGYISGKMNRSIEADNSIVTED
jgi:uncharacterized protein